MNQAALQRNYDGLCSVARVEAHENYTDVALDRRFGNAELTGDIFVALPIRQQRQDLPLSCAEVGIWSTRRQGKLDRLRKKAPAGMDTTKSLDQSFMRHAFDHVSLSARRERLVDVFIALIGGEHHKSSLRMFAADRTNRIDATHAGQPQIHQGDIGLVPLKELDCFFSGTCLGNCRHVRTRIDDGCYADAHQRMVIDNQDFYLFAILHNPSFAYFMRIIAASLSSV
jgi:hypothetical protein